jgi:hypothetical protein
VAKVTIVTPLSLLISCKLSFPIISFKMSSLPILASKSPNDGLKKKVGFSTSHKTGFS